jgi:hypothetical protein
VKVEIVGAGFISVRKESLNRFRKPLLCPSEATGILTPTFIKDHIILKMLSKFIKAN